MAFLGLLVASPVMIAIALWIAAISGRPVLFRQWRCGKNGRLFQILKFRTMSQDSDGPKVTCAGDSRVTPWGRRLRRWKLDELPQLINVVRGDMSLVGPRPDLPEIWHQADPALSQVLALRPGLTGAASLAFHAEEKWLTQAPAGKLMDFYLKTVFPQKVQLDLEYSYHASLWTDLEILLRTVFPWLRTNLNISARVPFHEQIPR